MASSSALTLVNKVLSLTGDYLPTATAITGLPGYIGERIINFLNVVIGDVEKATNWPVLRVESSGTGNGTDTKWTFNGTEDVRVGGGVSVWIPQIGNLKELDAEQFNEIKALDSAGGNPRYFVRYVDAVSGKLGVEIFPAPLSGQVINMTAYRKATRLDAAIPTGTTDFDDDILVYGALKHMDAFDGMDRGYAAQYQNHLNDMIVSTHSNVDYVRTVEDYR